MRAAVVNDGVVTNVILLDPDVVYEPDGELVELADDSPVSPGWSCVDGECTPPPSRTVTLEGSTVTVTTTYPEDEGAEVVFTANGVSATDTVVDGAASCDVTVAETTTVEVSVAGVLAGSVDITVEA